MLLVIGGIASGKRSYVRTRGYDDAKPINVMLCRTCGKYDSLRQGHHRVSACIALGVERMAVRFSAAGALAWPCA